MTLPAQSHLAWKISISILHTLAFLSATLRLYYRFKSRFWWDDAAVAIALVMDIFYFAHFWVKNQGRDVLWTTPLPSRSLLWSPWFIRFLFSTILWFSRTSLVLCVLQIFLTTRPRFQKALVGLSVSFLCFYVAGNIAAAQSCDHIEGAPWYTLDYGKCKFIGKETLGLVLSVIFDFLSEGMLFAMPLWLVLTTQIRHRRTRALLIAVFCSNIAIFAVSLVRLMFYLTTKKHPDGLLIYIIMTHVQSAASLIVANLIVDVLVINRLLRKAAGLNTFSDDADTEVITDDRAVETVPNHPSDNGGHSQPVTNTNSSSLGTIEFTPISTRIYTQSGAASQLAYGGPILSKYGS